jgi:hypothetical protein
MGNRKSRYKVRIEDEYKKDFESKLGKPIYSFTIYQKIKRVTITLENEEYPILMASFDIEADHENIIVNKMLPMINEEGL